MGESEKKRESGISRIVGLDEPDELELLDYFKRQFEKDQKYSIDMEHPPEFDILILEINKKMKEFMALYGIQSLEIPSRNIHMLDKSKLNQQQLEQLKQRYEKVDGIYVPGEQSIIVFQDYVTNNKLRVANILVHEMIHINSFDSMQKVKEGGLGFTKGGQSLRINQRRTGFEINSPKTAKIFFFGINEAITEELTIRFDHNYFSEFQDLKPEYEERQEAIKVVAKNSGKEIKDLEKTIGHLKYDQTKGVQFTVRSYGYHYEREKLNLLINDLYQKNKAGFQSPEDVFTLFAKAALNGRLLPISRLIEKTYGKGSFRELGKRASK